jgi:hypothetical protein
VVWCSGGGGRDGFQDGVVVDSVKAKEFKTRGGRQGEARWRVWGGHVPDCAVQRQGCADGRRRQSGAQGPYSYDIIMGGSRCITSMADLLKRLMIATTVKDGRAE